MIAGGNTSRESTQPSIKRTIFWERKGAIIGLLEYATCERPGHNEAALQPKKALAYIRVSHEDSADRRASLESQRRDIERYAEREGIEIGGWFEEPGKSAFKDSAKRPEMLRLIKSANDDPAVSIILVWKSDRFSRDRYHAAAVKGELAKNGVRVVSVMEPYDSRTTSGMVMESFTDAINQIRSMEIGLVTHKSLLVNCEMRDSKTGWAYKNGGMAQFGYRNERVYADVERKYQRISHCIWILDNEIVAGKPVYEWARTTLIEWRLKERPGRDLIAKRLTKAEEQHGLTAASTTCLCLTSSCITLDSGYGTAGTFAMEGSPGRTAAIGMWSRMLTRPSSR